MFGLAEPFDILADGSSSTRVLGELTLGVFMLLIYVLLLNLLIARANASFQAIHENSDAEFKFARAVLIRDYELFPGTTFPLDLPCLANVSAILLTFVISCSAAL